MRTTLNLLTRNGAVYMDFTPALSADQYAKLLEIVGKEESADELRIAVREWADEEGLSVRFEE
jgi:hypothetical protein